MKTNKIIFVLVILLIVIIYYRCAELNVDLQHYPENSNSKCNQYGNLDSLSKKGKLNALKNRPIIEKKHATKIDLTDFLNDGEDSAFFKNDFIQNYVFTEGYIVSGEDMGPESCNCDLAKKGNHDGDIHFYIASSPNATKYQSMIAEVTPAYRVKFGSPDAVVYNGKKVRVYGYLFYDVEHRKNSINTCKTCDKKNPNPHSIWRKTCWEIHPVVKIEVL